MRLLVDGQELEQAQGWLSDLRSFVRVSGVDVHTLAVAHAQPRTQAHAVAGSAHAAGTVIYFRDKHGERIQPAPTPSQTECQLIDELTITLGWVLAALDYIEFVVAEPAV